MSRGHGKLKIMSSAELLTPLIPDHPSNHFISLVVIVIIYVLVSYLIIDFVSEEEDSSSRAPGSPDGPSGMSFEELQQHLPWFGYRGWEASQSCAICLDAFKIGSVCRTFPICRHIFHSQCIDPWLSRSRSCPICRSPLGQRASLENV